MAESSLRSSECVCHRNAGRRRYSSIRFTFLGVILMMGCLIAIYTNHSGTVDKQNKLLLHRKHLLDKIPVQNINVRTRRLLQVTQLSNYSTSTPPKKGIYPTNIFTEEQLKNGAVVLHALGMLYMFVALAIVCDEFFVPSLGVIIDKVKISDDVAGATFMAAGGSAPELFTSLIGVFLAQSDVGIGTIVGSAVFNILFVIGMCAIVSKAVLKLTWWPLFRDCLFYTLSLVVLIVVFNDARIYWFEAIALLVMYFLYVLFMKFNVQLERIVKARLNRTIKTISIAEPIGKEMAAPRNRRHSVPHFRNSNMFRHGALQLMLHTIDPLSETVVHEKAVQLRAMAKAASESSPTPQANGTTNSHQPMNNHQWPSKPCTEDDNHNGRPSVVSSPKKDEMSSSSRECILGAEHLPEEEPVEQLGGRISTISHPNIPEESSPTGTENRTVSMDMVTQSTLVDDPSPMQEIPEIEVEEPLDISWPTSFRKRVMYIILAPLVFPMWVVLPDVRREDRRKYFPVTFLGSIAFIAAFSYLMVWWATVLGDTIGIPEPVMGLTFLAAGTSIPDLITSVIVARKGMGDMAVSSSVGSNIFDITVGLPFPWLLFSIINSGNPVIVESANLFCSILLLFGMLMFFIVSVAIGRWQMTKTLGISMFVLYVIFITISLLLEFNIIPCLL